MIKNCPKNIRMREWMSFVNHTLTTKAKEKSNRNAENRRKKRYSHTSGTKSYARIRAEEDEFETLSRSELESSELIDEDEIYHKVVGKERHGRVCGYGLGPTPASVFGANPCRLELLDKLTEANKLNEKMLTKLLSLWTCLWFFLHVEMASASSSFKSCKGGAALVFIRFPFFSANRREKWQPKRLLELDPTALSVYYFSS
ncbi:hypothetical protein CRYUN_Cryun40dG0043700 [Craigia yunnanensis]